MYSYVNIILQAMPPTKSYKTLKEGRILEQKFTFSKGKFLFFSKTIHCISKPNYQKAVNAARTLLT